MRTIVPILALLAPLSAVAAPTGALDLELTERGKSFVLSDPAYEVSFPAKPNVTQDTAPSPAGTLTTGSAMYANGNTVYGFFMIPIPKGVDYDAKKGMDGARDGALTNVNAKIVREEAINLGGLKGRHTIAAAQFEGAKLRVELQMAWDDRHRVLVALFTANDTKEITPTELAFFASFKVNPAGKAPPSSIK